MINLIKQNFSQNSSTRFVLERTQRDTELFVVSVDAQAVTWIWHCVNSRAAWHSISADSHSMTRRVLKKTDMEHQAHNRILFYSKLQHDKLVFCAPQAQETRCKRTVRLQWGNVLINSVRLSFILYLFAFFVCILSQICSFQQVVLKGAGKKLSLLGVSWIQSEWEHNANWLMGRNECGKPTVTQVFKM